MDVIMPQLGETVAEGIVTRWYKKVGDAVKADETLFDVETDKVSTEIPAPASGVIAEILVQEGVTAKVGSRLAVIRESGAAASIAAPVIAQSAVAAAPQAAASRAQRFAPSAAGERLSPVVRRLIAEHRLNPPEISGSGRDGRITREDVLAFIEQRGAHGPVGTVRTEPPAVYAVGAQTRKPLNKIRKRTGEHMLRSWTTAPHVLQAVEADFHRVEQARQAAGAAWKTREGFTLTYLPFIVRAVSAALARFPLLNASLDGDDLVLHQRINIGIAVDLDFDGLVVPVVKNAPDKSLPQLAREINDLAQRARSSRLKPDEMTAGTYTISNNGAFGTLITAPIINQPQVAILSTDGVRKKPVVIESPQGDSIVIRPVGVLAQTFDHRAVDGAYAAAFLRELKTLIESRDWTQELQG
jgi:2-oxoglutarate dehydrogenase E2 component (dihydrolipoamide succinyltransferase)